jgi:hypothetical protein
VGESITLQQLAKTIAALEVARVTFVTDAITAGAWLLAKKQTLKHGEWQPFCAKIWAEIRKWETVSHLDLHNFTRSLRGYTFLAQHFLADLEQNNFPAETQDVLVNPPAVAPAEVLTLDTLPDERRAAVHNAITFFVAGRSLRRMLTDFRRAEHAADQEEAAEAAAAATKGRGKGQDKGVQPGQIDFWDELKRPLDQIESLFTQKSFVERTDRAFWLKTAQALEAQAKRARKLAEEIAS